MLSRRKFLGLAGGAAALTFLETCIGPAADFGPYVPSPLETAITDAINDITLGDYAGAERRSPSTRTSACQRRTLNITTTPATARCSG